MLTICQDHFISDSQLVGQLSKTVTPHTERTGMFSLQANFFDYQDCPLFMLVLAQHKVADANRIPPKEHILERIQRHINLFSEFKVKFISILYSMLGLRHRNREWIEIIFFHRLFSLTARVHINLNDLFSPHNVNVSLTQAN